MARPPPFLLDSLLQVASANATSSILVSLKLPACEMGRRHFCNFLGKTKRRRHTSRGICISTWSISETDLLRFLDLSRFLAETGEEACVGCAAELRPLRLALLRHLPPCSFYLLLFDRGLEGLKVLPRKRGGREFENFFGERENLKPCFNLFGNKRSLKVIIYSSCQSCKRIILFVQTLCQNRKYFLSSNFVQEILIFLKLCTRGRKC